MELSAWKLTLPLYLLHVLCCQILRSACEEVPQNQIRTLVRGEDRLFQAFAAHLRAAMQPSPQPGNFSNRLLGCMSGAKHPPNHPM